MLHSIEFRTKTTDNERARWFCFKIIYLFRVYIKSRWFLDSLYTIDYFHRIMNHICIFNSLIVRRFTASLHFNVNLIIFFFHISIHVTIITLEWRNDLIAIYMHWVNIYFTPVIAVFEITHTRFNRLSSQANT